MSDLTEAKSELGKLRSRLEARRIEYAGSEPPVVDHNDLLPLVYAVEYLLEKEVVEGAPKP